MLIRIDPASSIPIYAQVADSVRRGLAEGTLVEGQRLRRGDLVGLLGSTGRSTGPHLHYEVLVGGKPVNPLDYVLNAF